MLLGISAPSYDGNCGSLVLNSKRWNYLQNHVPFQLAIFISNNQEPLD